MTSSALGYAQQFARFFRHHTGHDWQRGLASVSILGTATTMLLLSVSVITAGVVAESRFAQVVWPYFGLTTLAAIVLYIADWRRLTNYGGIWLVGLYLVLGTILTCRVGVGAGAVILFALAIILSSALYGFWFALVPTELCTMALITVRIGELQGWIRPEYVFVPRPTNFDTVIAIILLLNVLVLACGAVHHYMMQTYQRLQEAEAEKLQQLYRFAEIGEVSTALVHDLANKLTALNLEVEELKSQIGSPPLRRITRKVSQLNKSLHLARSKMHGQPHPEKFDITREVTQTVGLLQIFARKAHVTLDWHSPSLPIAYYGEKTLFQQALAILIKNAIDSYTPPRRTSRMPRLVQIQLAQEGPQVVLSVIDQGRGIKPEERERVFEPFYSTKKNGMGMGLYLTRRFIEDRFGGTISLETLQKKTVFSITLPKG